MRLLKANDRYVTIRTRAGAVIDVPARVFRVRREIDRGEYLTEARLTIAVERVLAEIEGKR